MRTEGLRDALKAARAMKEKMEEVSSKAMNRVGDGVMTEANRKIRATYQIKASDLKNTLRIVYASPQSSEVLIKSKGPNLPLTRFKFSPKLGNPRKPKTVRVEVRRGESKSIRSAYIRTSNEKVMIMKRKYPSGQSGQKRVKNIQGNYPELPVEQLRGPAVPVMMNEPQVIKHLEDQAKERMHKRLDHEIGRILK
ncbi:phage tail protein [Paenibacillus sp. NRS-1760]|uniref:phage tail protein n=1 Tax=Paenibacillus sp. NRS-1760 TaxID=3233902 RepID=UPI003D28FDA0